MSASSTLVGTFINGHSRLRNKESLQSFCRSLSFTSQCLIRAVLLHDWIVDAVLLHGAPFGAQRLPASCAAQFTIILSLFLDRGCVHESISEAPSRFHLLPRQPYPTSLLLFVKASSNNGSQAHLLHLFYGQQRLRPEQRIPCLLLNQSCTASKGAEPKSYPCSRTAESCQSLIARLTTYIPPTKPSQRTVVWAYTPIRSYHSTSHRRRRRPT